MPAISSRYKLAFFDTPKVASTSLKHVIYRLDHDQEFVPGQGGFRHIHQVYPTVKFDPDQLEQTAGYWRFAVVRDPVSRIVSAYKNRVVRDRELQKSWRSRLRARLHGLKPQPSLEEFCLQLPRYRKHRGTGHHTALISEFLGPDLGLYDAVFRLEDTRAVAQEIEQRTGQDVHLRHDKKERTSGDTLNLSKPAFDALLAYTQDEYAMLRGLYEKPQW